MGFECGFNAVKRLNNEPLKHIIEAFYYHEWENNPWNFEKDSTGKEHYGTFEEYMKGKEFKYSGEPSKDTLDYYDIHKDVNLGYWCSSGRCFDEYIINNLQEDHDELYEVTRDFLDKALSWVNCQLEQLELVSVMPVRGVKEDEDGNLIISHIDGVEIEDANGKLINRTNCFDDGFYYTEDSEKYWALHQFKDTLELMKVIKTLDVESEFVIWYWRSY